MKDRRAKSNRAQADYFELLVCQYICHLYNITFSYSKASAELSNKILGLPNGANRLKLQNDNFIKIQPKIKEILDYEINKKGKVVAVIWVGRSLLIETTSDVDVKHKSTKYTRFSIKSAYSGHGTLKNIGSRQLKKYLGINFSDQNNEMWDKLKNHTNETYITKGDLKNKVLNNQKLLSWAFENGKKYQILLNGMCLKSFNSLSEENKISFLNYITDSNDKHLYVIIVNTSGVIVYKPKERKIKLINKIEARANGTSDVGYTIFIDNVPTYRVQTNNTNGIGISPFCQRVFWSSNK